MALNIKNPEVEQLVEEIAAMAGESKTEAIHRALIERKQRLELRAGGKGRRLRLKKFLEHEIWPHLPREMLGVALSEEEHDRILGYGNENL